MTVDDNELTGVERIGTNSGHGYAWSRPDGLRARCGGEALCAECRADAELVTAGMELIPGTSKVEKTPGLLALERFVDNMGRYMESSEMDLDAWNEGVDGWSADLGSTGREGMKLLVRLALVAREWQNAAESYGSAAALGTCIDELCEWEQSL